MKTASPWQYSALARTKFKSGDTSEREKTLLKRGALALKCVDKKMPQFKIQSFIKSFNVSLMFSTFSFVNPEKK